MAARLGWVQRAELFIARMAKNVRNQDFSVRDRKLLMMFLRRCIIKGKNGPSFKHHVILSEKTTLKNARKELKLAQKESKKSEIPKFTMRLEDWIHQYVMYHFPGVEYEVIFKESIAYMRRRRWINSVHDLNKNTN